MLDVRAGRFTEDLAAVIKDLDARGYRPRVLFLEASDAVLIRRYEANRRAHPLQGGGRLADGVAAERERCSSRCGRRPTSSSTPPNCPCTNCAARWSGRSATPRRNAGV